MDSLLLLTLIIALVFAAVGISSPLMTLYLEALGASYAQIAVILATVAAVSLFSSYGWGRRPMHSGRRKPLLIVGLGGLVVTYILLSRATSASRHGPSGWSRPRSSRPTAPPASCVVGDLLAQRDRRGQRMGTYRGIGSLAFAGGAHWWADGWPTRRRCARCSSPAPSSMRLAAGVALLLREVRVPPVERAAEPAQPGTRPAPFRGLAAGLPLLFIAGVFLWTMAWNGQPSMWPNYMSTLGHSKTTISTLGASPVWWRRRLCG